MVIFFFFLWENEGWQKVEVKGVWIYKYFIISAVLNLNSGQGLVFLNLLIFFDALTVVTVSFGTAGVFETSKHWGNMAKNSLSLAS